MALSCSVYMVVSLSVRIAAGPIPSDLYGKFTWKIENFSEISKRELRSNVFEVGSYKWCVPTQTLVLLSCCRASLA